MTQGYLSARRRAIFRVEAAYGDREAQNALDQEKKAHRAYVERRRQAKKAVRKREHPEASAAHEQELLTKRRERSGPRRRTKDTRTDQSSSPSFAGSRGIVPTSRSYQDNDDGDESEAMKAADGPASDAIDLYGEDDDAPAASIKRESPGSVEVTVSQEDEIKFTLKQLAIKKAEVALEKEQLNLEMELSCLRKGA